MARCARARCGLLGVADRENRLGRRVEDVADHQSTLGRRGKGVAMHLPTLERWGETV